MCSATLLHNQAEQQLAAICALCGLAVILYTKLHKQVLSAAMPPQEISKATACSGAASTRSVRSSIVGAARASSAVAARSARPTAAAVVCVCIHV